MPRNPERYLSLLLSVLLTTTWVDRALGQEQQPDPVESALKYAEATEANSQALQDYMWQQRVEVKMGGEVVVTILEQVRYSEGELQTTLISQEPDEPGGGPRHRKERNAYEAGVDAAQSMPKLLMSYMTMTLGQTVDFFKQATLSPGTGDDEGTTQIQGNDVIHEGDSVTLVADLGSSTPRDMKLTTVVDENNVEAEMIFASTEDGPHYMSKGSVLLPDQDMELKIEIFDLRKQSGE